MEDHGEADLLWHAERWGCISRDYGENRFCSFCGVVRDTTIEQVLKKCFIHRRYEFRFIQYRVCIRTAHFKGPARLQSLDVNN